MPSSAPTTSSFVKFVGGSPSGLSELEETFGPFSPGRSGPFSVGVEPHDLQYVLESLGSEYTTPFSATARDGEGGTVNTSTTTPVQQVRGGPMRGEGALTNSSEFVFVNRDTAAVSTPLSGVGHGDEDMVVDDGDRGDRFDISTPSIAGYRNGTVKRADTPVPWMLHGNTGSGFGAMQGLSPLQPVNHSLGSLQYPNHSFSFVHPFGAQTKAHLDASTEFESKLNHFALSIEKANALADSLATKIASIGDLDETVSRVQKNIESLDAKLSDLKDDDALVSRMDALHGTFNSTSSELFEVYQRLLKIQTGNARRANQCTRLLKKVNEGTENLGYDMQDVTEKLMSISEMLTESKDAHVQSLMKVELAQSIFRRILSDKDSHVSKREIRAWLEM